MKYFLKCDHCQHLNDVSTEYLTFCDNCKKKLKNTFREWQKKHNGGSLDEFKKAACISENELNVQAGEKTQNQVDEWNHWIPVSVTLSIIIGILLFMLPFLMGNSQFALYFYEQTVENPVFTETWSRQTYGTFGLSVESPVELSKGNLPIPSQAAGMIETIETYSSPFNGDFTVLLNNVKYRREIGSVNVEGAVTGMIQNIKLMPGTRNFHYDQKAVSVDGKQGFLQEGGYEKGGQEIEFISMGIGENLVLWQIIVGFPKGDARLEANARRVINSVRIYYNTAI